MLHIHISPSENTLTIIIRVALLIVSESVPWGWTIANMLVLKKVREALGFQRCKRFSVGAAPSKMETMEYFMSLNIPIMPMYGEEPHVVSTDVRPTQYICRHE